MQLSYSDLEVETIYSRVKRGDIDLQPDFQRGDVWPRGKKVKLIDSIFRGWKIPPIHVVISPDSEIWQVLDGQQRLTAIRDFIDNGFKFDGGIHPTETAFGEIDGIFFKDLPASWRRRLLAYDVRFIKLSDYSPEEPAELFFRLNQPISLTAAEQRNAFYGLARDQVKELSRFLDETMDGKGGIGFSNSRLAYDDVAARLLFFIERGLRSSFSNDQMVRVYRDSSGFEELSLIKAHNAIKLLGSSRGDNSRIAKFTKATLLSWLLFIARKDDILISPLSMAIADLETNRLKKPVGWPIIRSKLADFYNESVSFRVNEQGSMITRDMVIHWFYTEFLDHLDERELYKKELVEKFVFNQDSFEGSKILLTWDTY